MVICNMEDASRYEGLHPLFPTLFAYMRSHDLLHEPTGRITIDGDRLFINNSAPECLAADKQIIEVHRRYIDVHFLLEGSESIGWKPTGECTALSQPYDAEKECALYAEPAQTYVTLHPGQIAIVWPEDGHAPIIGRGTIRKAIAKILIED